MLLNYRGLGGGLIPPPGFWMLDSFLGQNDYVLKPIAFFVFLQLVHLLLSLSEVICLLLEVNEDHTIVIVLLWGRAFFFLINVNLWFAFKPEPSELLCERITQHLLTNQNWEFNGSSLWEVFAPRCCPLYHVSETDAVFFGESLIMHVVQLLICEPW